MNTILLVGDDWVGLEQLEAVMEGYGYSVEIIMESLDVESMLEANPGIGMVVIQEHMPVLNGYEVAEMLRNNPDISLMLPVILLVRQSPSYRKLEGASISDVLRVDADQHQIQECIVRHMEQYV